MLGGVGNVGRVGAGRRRLLASASVLTLTTAKLDADSRTASAGNWDGGRVTTARASSGLGGIGFAALIQPLAGNIFLIDQGHNHAVGDTTTLAMLERSKSLSVATTGNPAFAITARGADANFSINSDGRASVLTQTGNIVVSASVGVNDTASYFNTRDDNVTAAVGWKTVRHAAAYADALGAAGKRWYVGNEIPRGRAQYFETKTVASGTCSATNTGNFVDGESYGAVGVVGVFAAGAPRPLVKVASAPAQDQYTVSAGGVYAFGGTAPISVFIAYNANGTSGNPTDDRIRVINEWCNSSAANFVSTVNGIDYLIAGLQYNRPWVRVVDTFNAVLDTASGALQLALPGTMDNLQLHGFAPGQHLVATAFKAKFDADFPGAKRLDYRPTRNNWYSARGTGAAGVSHSGTLPPSMRWTAGNEVPTLISVNGVPIGRADTATGVITGTGIASGALNFATGAWSIAWTASATSMPNNAQLWFEQDIGNFDVATLAAGTISRNPQMNGLLDMTPASGSNLTVTTGTTSVTGLTGSQIPYGWDFTNAALNAAIANNNATSNATVSVRVTTAAGFNRFNLAIAGIHTAIIQAGLTQTVANGPNNRMPTTGEMFVAGEITYAAHPTIGRLYGTTAGSLTQSSVTPPVTRTGSSGSRSDTVAVSTRIQDTGTALYIDDKLLAVAGGPLTLYRASPLLDLTGPAGSAAVSWTSLSVASAINTVANVPFAVEFGIGRLQLRNATAAALAAAA